MACAGRHRAGRVEAQIVDVSPYETEMHVHEHYHELLWHVRGSMYVESEHGQWQLLPRTGVWMPAGVAHRLCGRSDARFGWAYVDAAASPAMWAETRHVEVNALLHHLLQHSTSDLDHDERANVEDVIFDLLRRQLSVPVAEIPMPADDRCRAIAEALLADPGCDRSLVAWAAEIGAGSRTLTRLWVDETGVTFSDWRATLRLRAAIVGLAAGQDVGVVARRVGYRTASAFVASFRRQTGRTPARYLADLDRSAIDGGDLVVLADIERAAAS